MVSDMDKMCVRKRILTFGIPFATFLFIFLLYKSTTPVSKRSDPPVRRRHTVTDQPSAKKRETATNTTAEANSVEKNAKDASCDTTVSLQALNTSVKKHPNGSLGLSKNQVDFYKPLPAGQLQYFKPSLHKSDFAAWENLLKIFLNKITSAGLEYFMYGGTLIGSYRHHGFIPWDDDIDLFMDANKIKQIQELLSSMAPEYSHVMMYNRLKFYITKGKFIPQVKWTYPFLDISFYHDDGLTVYDADPGFAGRFKYPRDWVFPLVKRPFMNLMLNAPGQSEKFIKRNYDISKCVSVSYNHRTETRVGKVVTVSCKDLHPFFPFVHRTIDGEKIREDLKVGEKIINTVTI